MFEFAGIKRSLEFSPNHRGNDNSIFNLTVEELKKLGSSTVVLTEDELLLFEKVAQKQLFTMARSKQSVRRMQQLEEEGALIVNSAFAIENCYRANMTSILQEAGIPYPRSCIVPTDGRACSFRDKLDGQNFWIKRGDFHAIHKEDVSFAHSAQQAADILKEYRLRGIQEAVISEHLYGDLVKFYGVSGTDFFYWFYPLEFNHSKFNAEMINGAASYFEFDVKALRTIGTLAAKTLGVDVYGGDAIISKQGDIHIIDLNDWPSFAPCRDEAAYHIAQRIYQKATLHATLRSLS
jgi:hypothetical protein